MDEYGLKYNKIIGPSDTMVGGGAGGTEDTSDLYIPFGLYCRKSGPDYVPTKQTVSKKMLDDDIFEKLFGSVLYGSTTDKTHKTVAPAVTKRQTRKQGK
uniref:Uncharacterized protein n=1 Tax=viral metagenome TaxID=1070528 RepID=A0A6C0B509_9ZZZZ